MFAKFLLLFLFPVLAHSQTFKKDRFVATNKTIVWTEQVEIKDMDTPIIVETLTEKLKRKQYIQLDSVQKQPNILTGWLIKPPKSTITKARFRIDILYESYIVTVSAITEDQNRDEIALENTLLKIDGRFIERFPERIEKIDETLVSIFEIGH